MGKHKVEYAQRSLTLWHVVPVFCLSSSHYHSTHVSNIFSFSCYDAYAFSQ